MARSRKRPALGRPPSDRQRIIPKLAGPRHERALLGPFPCRRVQPLRFEVSAIFGKQDNAGGMGDFVSGAARRVAQAKVRRDLHDFG